MKSETNLINQLIQLIQKLQKENNELKYLLKANKIPLSSSIENDSLESIEEYDLDQASRIIDERINYDVANKFFYMFWGRMDVYARRGKNGGYFTQCDNRWNSTCPIYNGKIKKCEKDNTGHVLSGAVFELRDGDTVLGFTEISPGHYSYSENGTVTRLTTPTNGYIRISALKAGIYTVRELVPPYGYVTSAQTTVTFDENTPDRSLEIEIENEKFVLVLPQTGAGGVTLFYTFGVLLCLGALMYGIYGKRKRKEVNRTS